MSRVDERNTRPRVANSGEPARFMQAMGPNYVGVVAFVTAGGPPR